MKIKGFGIQSLTKNCNEILILTILAEEKKHGYQLALEIDEKSSGYFKFNHGTLYPILHKLEKDKLIKGTWKNEGPKRQRKYYSITASGKKYTNSLLEEWQNFINHFLLITGEVKNESI